MALTRVKTANTGSAECAEAQFALLAALGSDGKPYALEVNEATGQLPVTSSAITSILIREKAYHNYAVQGATTLAWLQVIASTSAAITDWDVWDSSGSVLQLGAGTAGNEVAFTYIPPGGSSIFRHAIAAGTRISIKAVDVDTAGGKLVINAWG
jgi:hypothetical protein